MSTPTATPRTTAALEWVRPAGNDSGPPNEQYVCADVARTLETELARLRAELAVAENWVEHHSQHADDLIAENVKLRADLERFTGHGLLDCHAICDQRDAAIARAERAEAERDALAKDKARLDWLSVSDAWFDYPATGAFTPDTMRAAIDAAMKP